MRRWAALLGAALLATAVWGTASELGGNGDTPPSETPTRLLDVRRADVIQIDVVAPGTGRSGALSMEDGSLRIINGDRVDGDVLARLEDALFPLLAIRVFETAPNGSGLTDPQLLVTVETEEELRRVRVGGPNFDGTGVYVEVDGRPGLALPVIAEALGAVVGLSM